MSSHHQDDLFPWEMTEEAAPADNPGVSALAPHTPAAPAHAARMERAERRDERGAEGAAPEVEAAPPAPRDRTVAPREYYSISEVCDLVGLKPHVLRYWETQFGPLNPSKNRSGNRVYQRKEIRLIVLVKHLLYEEKYTVEGARAKLEQLRRTGHLPEFASRALSADTAQMIRTELEQLARLLSAAAPAGPAARG